MMAPASSPGPNISVIDDDGAMRSALDSLLRAHRFHVETYATAREFLASTSPQNAACLILDLNLGDEDGLSLQEQLLKSAIPVPIVFLTGFGDVATTARGMRAGAVHFLTKPVHEGALLDAVNEAILRDNLRRVDERDHAQLRNCYASLSRREREVMRLVTTGLMNKQIAGHLGITEITVKVHRARVMQKMEARRLPDLVLMAQSLGIHAPHPLIDDMPVWLGRDEGEGGPVSTAASLS